MWSKGTMKNNLALHGNEYKLILKPRNFVYLSAYLHIIEKLTKILIAQ